MAKRNTLDDWEDERNSETKWLTPKEASAFTGLGLSTLAKMRSAKIGPAFSRPLDNAVRYARSDLDAWMASKRVQQAAE
jgi:predicted DNA-binding transcriptional regulator AlpA